jgi:hypothetical protein
MSTTETLTTTRIWSESYRGHLAHAYPDPNGSALCRKNLPARQWAPDWQPSFQAPAGLLVEQCPRCLEKL